MESIGICLSGRHYHHVIDVYMRRTFYHIHYGISYIHCSEWCKSFVHIVCTLPVTFEAHQGEFSLHSARTYLGYPYTVFEKVYPHPFCEGINSMFGSTIYISIRINLQVANLYDSVAIDISTRGLQVEKDQRVF